MHLRGFRVPLWVRCTGAAWLALVVSPVFGQYLRQPDKPLPYCPPPCPVPFQPTVPASPPVPAPPTIPPKQLEQRPPADQPPQPPRDEQQQALPQPQEPSISPEQSAAAGGESVALASPSMFGDQLSIPAIAFAPRPLPGLPAIPGSRTQGSAAVPSVRSFKISENESPRPRDRVYLGFNYFDNVNAAVNTRLGVGLRDVNVHRETFGFEKTFADREASIGLRLPLNTLSADSNIPGLGGTSTDVGDLSIIGKYVVLRDDETGSLLSAGLAVTAPTGPDAFAGSSALAPFHSTTLQPYLGYIWNAERLFLHGFLAVNVPMDSGDVTLLHNDIGVGYYLYRTQECGRLLTAVVPTFEVHVNNPLNHRGAFNFADPVGTPDWVTLTTGATFELNRRSTLAAAIATPVTGPKPYDLEVLVQFNLRFGGPSAPGVIGN